MVDDIETKTLNLLEDILSNVRYVNVVSLNLNLNILNILELFLRHT